MKINRFQIVYYLIALLRQQEEMTHFKSVYQKSPKPVRGQGEVGYAGFMYGLGLVAPLWRHLEQVYREQNHILFDEQTIVDSSLMPAKTQPSIVSKDWKAGHVTSRSRNSCVDHICGEKLLVLLNSKHHLVFAGLMNSINSSDQNVFKHPMQWASKGLRYGVLLADRGFSNKKVYEGLAFLRQTLPAFTLEMISPPHPKQTWSLSPQQRLLYQKRWEVEEAFRQLKDPFGRFRLTMMGVRRKAIRAAKVAISTLAWNMEHTQKK